VLDTLYDGQVAKEKTDWTLTNGFRTTTINFEEIRGRSYRIGFDDEHALTHTRFPFGRYEKEYHDVKGCRYINPIFGPALN